MASISFTTPVNRVEQPSATVVNDLADLETMPLCLGQSFNLPGVFIARVDPGSYMGDYTVLLVSGLRSFCVKVEFIDDGNSKLTLRLWAPFEKVIGMTAADFVKLNLEDQVSAFSSIDSTARYNLVVKQHPDGGFKLVSLVRV